MRYVSAGKIFRKLAKERKMTLEAFSALAETDPAVDKMLDERTRAEAKRGGVVIDAQLGAWMARDLADLKLLITAPDEVRFRRIARRDGRSYESAQKETLARELIQKRRYKKYYGIDVDDLSVYDLRIDTGSESVERTKVKVVKAAREFLAQRNRQ